MLAKSERKPFFSPHPPFFFPCPVVAPLPWEVTELPTPPETLLCQTASYFCFAPNFSPICFTDPTYSGVDFVAEFVAPPDVVRLHSVI